MRKTSDQNISNDPDEQKRIEMQKILLSDANKLLEYITIEMTVGSQMDTTRKQIKDLTKICKDEDRMIQDLEKQIQEEINLSNELDQTETITEQVDNRNIDYIVQLENELKELYEEKVRLLNKRRQK
ncbi:hypothetical protein M9Y10_011447 [Tritrichomonas musculus]|uniref:Uncharacterized protein n=1 Tax=Tritrichomonas musculus TaxID=1915356 RepID=A0ABR2IKL5_9EUKA